MRALRILALAIVASLLLLIGITPANAASVKVVATFSSPKTDGLSKVTGRLAVVQQTPNGTVTVRGQVAGLAPNSLYVAVPYKDPACTPLPGLTAFPSGSFFTTSTGTATVWTTVNPKSINPLGQFNAADTKSVSIRRVIIQALPLPGVPIGTPTVPNVVAVEACDRAPVRKR